LVSDKRGEKGKRRKVVAAKEKGVILFPIDVTTANRTEKFFLNITRERKNEIAFVNFCGF
jgi:hypothetical protein